MAILGNSTATELTVLHSVTAGSFVGNLEGTATTATTAVNLSAAPVLTASSNKITVTAGGKTSAEFTVPFATSSTSATGAGRLNASSPQSTSHCLYYYSGQPAIGTSSGNSAEGSNSSYTLWSYPKNGTATNSDTKANIQSLRLQWGSTYLHEIFASPNYRQLWHRWIDNGTAKPWSRFVLEDNASESRDEWNITVKNANNVPWSGISGKPAVSVVGHTHTKAEITDFSHTHEYLPLTGGTLANTTTASNTPLTIKGTGSNNDSWIAYHNNSGFLASVGVDSSKNFRFYYNNASHKIWHEGNDGSGSGLDADKLDGKDSTAFALVDHTTPKFTGATSSADGAAGHVPAPLKADRSKFLKGDGTWASPTNTIPSGYCTSATDAAAKAASFTYYTTSSSYAPTPDRYFQITFRYGNTKASAITLNVNSSGAKPLYINGNPSSASNYEFPYGPYIVYYDGENYYINTDGTIPFYEGTKISKGTDSHLYLTWDNTNGRAAWKKIDPYDYAISREANTVLAAPNGSSGSASFRKLVAADLPSHTHSYLPLSGGTLTGNLTMMVSNSHDKDQFIRFKYSSSDTDAYSWRLGYLGTGSGDANYFVIQSSHGGSWNSVMQLGLQTYEAVFKNSVKATKFIGPLEGTAQTATKLASAINVGLSGAVLATTQRFDGSSNLTIPISELKESFITWGGKTNTGSVGPIGAALSSEHSANRLAYVSPAAIKIEYSNDSGSTWTDMGVSNENKVKLTTTEFDTKIGSATTVTTAHRTRITITARDESLKKTYFYTRPKKLLLNVNTSGHSINVKIESITGASGATWVDHGTHELTGWSGWNDIPLILNTLGSYDNQLTNVHKLRLTFATTSVNSGQTTKFPAVKSIRLFGDMYWVKASELASTGHLYSYDWQQNATFPNTVIATNGFTGNLNGTATNATTANNALNLGGKAASEYSLAHSHPYLSNTLSSIEFNTTGSLPGYGGFLDFHYHREDTDKVVKPMNADGTWASTLPDYTSRIIEDAPGQISVNRVSFKNGVVTTPSSGKFVGPLEGNASTATTANSVPWTGVTAAITHGNEFNVYNSNQGQARFWFNYRGRDDSNCSTLITDYLFGSGAASGNNKYAYLSARGVKAYSSSGSALSGYLMANGNVDSGSYTPTTYGSTSAVTVVLTNDGGLMNLPYFNVDKYGHVTGGGTTTVNFDVSGLSTGGSGSGGTNTDVANLSTDSKYLLTRKVESEDYYSNYKAYIKWINSTTAAMRFTDDTSGSWKFKADLAGTADTVAWGGITNKPSEYAPATHTRDKISDFDHSHSCGTPSGTTTVSTSDHTHNVGASSGTTDVASHAHSHGTSKSGSVTISGTESNGVLTITVSNDISISINNSTAKTSVPSTSHTHTATASSSTVAVASSGHKHTIGSVSN